MLPVARRGSCSVSRMLRMLGVLGVVAAVSLGAAAPVAGQGARGCPLRFDRHTIGLQRTCLFVGRYSPTCGGNALGVFAGDGSILVVGIAITPERPIVYLPAMVDSATRAVLVRWSDTESARPAALGHVTLEDDGELLRVRGPRGLFNGGDCPFEEYVGRFVEMVDAGPEAQRFARPPTPDLPTPSPN